MGPRVSLRCLLTTGSQQFNSSGYGIGSSRGLSIFHRWADVGNGRTERFIIALNFTDSDQWVDVPFSVNGQRTRSTAMVGLRFREHLLQRAAFLLLAPRRKP